jgi:hypothetical protein
MKKTVLVTAVGVAGIIATLSGMFWAGGVIVGKLPAPIASGIAAHDRALRSFSLSGFTAVSAGGFWDLRIERADAFSVEVDVPANLAGKLAVKVSGGALVLGFDDPGFAAWAANGRATVRLPALAAVDLAGGSKLKLSGFRSERLSLTISGAGKAEADRLAIGELKLNASGAADVDFRGARVRNAAIAIAGAGKLELTMDGGELTGSIDGAGKIVYYGRVSRVDVRRSGVASIEDKTRD